LHDPGSSLVNAAGEYVDPFDADWKERLVVLGGMFATLVVGVTLGLHYANSATKELFGLVPASFFAAGKFLPLWGISETSNFTPYGLGLVIWVMDTCTVLIVVYSLEAFYRFDRLKRGLDKIQRNAGLVLDAYPRIRTGAVVGVVVFVLFPIAGTGAIGGAFLGVLLGLHRFVLIAAVSTGGFLGGMLMAFAASNFAGTLKSIRATQEDPTVKYVIMAVVGLLLVVAFMWLSRVYKRALAAAERRQSDASLNIAAHSSGNGDNHAV